MSDDSPLMVLVGLVLWGLVFYPVWSPRCRRIRKARKSQGVSGNKTGPAWEQDYVYDEVFEEDEGREWWD